MAIDLAVLYEILVQRAGDSGGSPIRYKELSDAYSSATGEWHEPHGSWDAPLGELNSLLADAGLPALSALVVLAESGEPGGGFWGSAPGVPRRPSDPVERAAVWLAIVKSVNEAQWPSKLPTSR